MIPLTDNPVMRNSEDMFGFRSHVQAIHKAVAAAEPLPLTVGVFGSWGTGKSSFLGMWRDVFQSEGTHTIWFNPWKYDRKVEVWAALLHTILGEMEQPEGLRDKASRLARAATWLSLRAGLGHAASLATGGVLNAQHLGEMLDSITASDSHEYRQISRFEYDFRDAVEEFVEPGGRLVVFVDDLDRCTPDAAVTVLESLKLFLGQSQCVFILALDVDVLAAVATNKFGQALQGAPEEAISGMAYLEKIVQLPFFLPAVSFPVLRSALAQYVGELGDNEAFWDLIQLGLGSNPRRVKRFINVLNLAALTLEVAGSTPIHLRAQLQLAELLIIRAQHRAFFHQLIREPNGWRILEEFASRVAEHPNRRSDAVAALPLYLVPFIEDESLMRLLETRPGSYNNHPPAPEGDEVVRMISTLQQVTGLGAGGDA